MPIVEWHVMMLSQQDLVNLKFSNYHGHIILDGGDDGQVRPGVDGEGGRGSSLSHGEQRVGGMDLKGRDAPAGPEELELPTLDVEEVEEVAGCEEQSVLVQNVEVVTTSAVIAKTVAQSETLRTEMSRDVRGVIQDNLLLLLAGGV